MTLKRKISLLILIVLSIALYINYNLSVFHQIVAHYFYKPVEVRESLERDFSCIAVNVVRGDTFLDRNQFILRGGAINPMKYEYSVDLKMYNSRMRSYTGPPFRCGETLTKAYYFPLVPSWAVADNSIPEAIYMRNFLVSTLAIFVLILGIFLYARNSKN